jgi:polyketide cyclase/dehydrase/lipid transport protein
MQTLDHDQLSVHIDAPPEAVYALVADITRTPEFSPEIVSCTWLDGATGPAAGARFEAVNKVSRGPAWKNRPVVIAAQPGREFAFSRTEKLSGTLVWRYRLEPDGTGTRLTESYDVTRPISRLGWFIIDRLFGCHDRRAELRAGMNQTLRRIRETAERDIKSGHTPPGAVTTP